MSDIKSHFPTVEHPPGLVGISSSTMGRYREFDITLGRVTIPRGSIVSWQIGLYLALNYNNLCRELLKNKELEWLWILNDDHVFKPDILTRLLERNVDIVMPLCLKRSGPFQPVIYEAYESGGYKQLEFDYINGKEGLLEVDGIGHAGILIRRNVIEKMKENWHKVGWLNSEYDACDLYFCKKAKEEGFKIFVDLDNTIGHLTHMAVWPVKENGEYSVGVREALNMPKDKLDRVEGISVE